MVKCCHCNKNHLFIYFQELLQLENLCKQLYETADTNLRSEAEKALVAFADSPDCLNKCQLLLERGNVSLKLHKISLTGITPDKEE